MKKTISIDGLNLTYEESGDCNNPPVLLMHGWGCDHSTVKYIADSISDKRRVINIDLPGHGESDEPSEIWGVEEFTVLIEKLISELKLINPAVIGHSFGGRVGIILASRNKIEKLVLVDAAGIKPKRKPKYYIKVYSYKFIKRLITAIYPKEKAEKKISDLQAKRGSADYKNSSPVMRGIMSKCVNQDLKKYMPLIKTPTLLMWGENDTATPLSDALIMEKLIPDAGLVNFKGCGHYSFLDDPVLFRKVLKQFI